MSRFDTIQYAICKTVAMNGEIWECGCFEGDLATAMIPFIGGRTFRLFDTFDGMPACGPNDHHKIGSMKADRTRVFEKFRSNEQVIIHAGRMPATFAGLEGTVISVANLDVDNEECVRECLPWLYRHIHPGGYLFIDDYNCGSCPGAKIATNEFMSDKPEELIHSYEQHSPQAYLIKQ